MKEIWRNMSTICKNMWKMWRNMKEYEERCQYIGFGTPISMALELGKIPSTAFIWSLGLWKIPRPSFLLGSGTWKNFKLCLYIGWCRLSDLENSELCLYTGSGIWKNVKLPLPSITACWWGVTLLFCLLHISSKLFLLTYSSKPQKC